MKWAALGPVWWLALLACSAEQVGGGAAAGASGASSGSGGSSGHSGGGSSGDSGGAGTAGDPPVLGDWPASCVERGTQPASADVLTRYHDDWPVVVTPPGQVVEATLNDLPRSFDDPVTFKNVHHSIGSNLAFLAGGPDGSIMISVPSLEPGTYSCPEAELAYRHAAAGYEGNVFDRSECCKIVIEGGGSDEPLEGKFSGIVTGERGFVLVTKGNFRLTLDVDPNGGRGGSN